MNDLNQLLDMLTYKRPHLSLAENAFIEKYLKPLAHHGNVVRFWEDSCGNVYVVTCPDSKTLFTAHIDTVHSEGGLQSPSFDTAVGVVYLDEEAVKSTNCLGADDTAGIWMLLQLIDHGVKGAFVFFRGEERGGIGSRFAANTHPDFFEHYDRAIAFDRRGTGDVITRQSRGQCASQEFAQSFCDALNQQKMDYRPSDRGVFTDTANLTALIAECTNVSIGYMQEHSVDETLDVEHLFCLRDALVSIDFEALAVSRKPGQQSQFSLGFFNYENATQGELLDDTCSPDDVMYMSHSELRNWVKYSEPEAVAELIQELAGRLSLYELEDDHQIELDDGVVGMPENANLQMRWFR